MAKSDAFRMDKMIIIQDSMKDVARVNLIAYDNRTKQEVNLVLYVEIVDKDQNVKPIAENALEKLGYAYLGITDVEVVSVIFDCESAWEHGKESE